MADFKYLENNKIKVSVINSVIKYDHSVEIKYRFVALIHVSLMKKIEL